MSLRSSVGDAVGLGIFFCNSGKIEISPGGLPIAQASTLFFANPQFKETAPLLYISPYEVIRCGDNRQATYCHLLCGLLRSSEVTIIGAIFASGVAYAISLLKELWPDIATDIETGQLSNLVTDPAVRAQVSKILAAPNPELAEFVRAECSRESWEGIVPRLWPGVRLITGVTTGSMLQYIDYINFHTAGGILLSSTYYSGTEGQYGFNPCLLNPPHETFYVLQHNEIIYFEFIRVTGEQPEHGSQPRGQDDDDTATRLVNLAGVKEGETYEMVISNGEGNTACVPPPYPSCFPSRAESPLARITSSNSSRLCEHCFVNRSLEIQGRRCPAMRGVLPSGAQIQDRRAQKRYSKHSQR